MGLDRIIENKQKHSQLSVSYPSRSLISQNTHFQFIPSREFDVYLKQIKSLSAGKVTNKIYIVSL